MSDQSSAPQSGDGGVGEVVKAMQGLRGNAEKRFGVGEGGKGSSGTNLSYGLEARLFVNLDTHWEVIPGFRLTNIRLDLNLSAGSDGPGHVGIELSATAVIKDIEVKVQASLPWLEDNIPTVIIFRVSLRSTSSASPNTIVQNVGSITGGSDQLSVSSMVDSNLQEPIATRRLGGSFELVFVKPPNEPIVFTQLFLSFGGNINWAPQLGNTTVAITKARFILQVTRPAKDKVDNGLQVRLQLLGEVKINAAILEGVAVFSRIKGKYGFDLKVRTSDNLSLGRNLSATEFLKGIGGISYEDPSSNLSIPGDDKYLALFKRDLNQNALDLVLTVSLADSKLRQLFFQAYAYKLFTFSPDFLGGGSVRDVHILVDLHPEVKSRAVLLRGTIDLASWQFSTSLKYLKTPADLEVINFRAALKHQNRTACSLEQLARIDIFNQDVDPETPSDKRPKPHGLVEYAKTNSVGGDSPLSLDQVSKVTLDVNIEFELEVSRRAVSKTEKAAPKEAKDTTGKREAGKTETYKDNKLGAHKQDNSFQVDRLKIFARYNRKWDIIANHIQIVDMGIAVYISKPRLPQKTIQGLIYGKWKLENYTLWTYVLGQSKKDEAFFWLGLNLESSTKNDSTIAGIIADPKFAKDLALPDLQAHKDIQAKPKEQTLASGLAIDGRLRVKFVKKGPQGDKSKQPEEGESDVKAPSDQDSVINNPPASRDGDKWRMEVIEAQIDLTTDFKIFEDNALADVSLYVMITDPLDKEKRAIAAKLEGLLLIGKVAIAVYASIKLQGAKKLAENQKSIEDTRKTDIDNAAKKMQPLKQPVEEDDVNEQEDICFGAHVHVSEKQVEQVRCSDIISVLSGSSEDLKQVEGEKLPGGFPHKTTDLTSSVDFHLELRVGRRTNADKRSLKSFSLELRSTMSWTIVPDVLVLNQAALKLLVVNPPENKPQRGVFILGGQITLLSINASITAALVHANGELSFGVVVIIPLSKLISAFTTTPNLLEEHEKKQPKPEIVAAVSATVKDKSFDSYTIIVTTLGKIDVAEKVSIKDILLSLTKQAGTESKELILAGTLSLGTSSATLDLTGKLTFREGQTVAEFGLTVSPAKVLKSLQDDALQNKSKPELPDATGFNDWDKDSLESTKLAAATAELLFSDADGGGRKLKHLKFKLHRDKRWDLIDEKLWITELSLGIKYDFPDKKFSGFIEAKLFFMRRKPTSGDDDKTEMEKVPGVLPLKLEIEKKLLKFETDLKDAKIDNCNTTDLLYAVTGGWLNVPHWIGLPLFPRMKVALEWHDKQKASVDLFFTAKGHAWEISKWFSKIAKVLEPKIEATVFRKSGSDKNTASVKGTARLADLINVDVEFILPKGPLLIEGCDVEKIVKLAKRLWKLFRQVKAAVEAVAEVAEIVGGILGSLATAAEGLVTYGAILVGGLLGGALWASLKEKIIDAINDLEGKALDAIRRGLNWGLGLFESKKNPKDDDNIKEGGSAARDKPKKPLPSGQPLSPDGEPIAPDGSPLKDGDWFVQVGGTGSSSGVIGEVVELLVTVQGKPKPKAQIFSIMISLRV